MDVAACIKADATFYQRHPELGRRHLTMEPGDASLRTEWLGLYHQAIASKPKPPEPAVKPQSTQAPPPPTGSVQSCPYISSLTHQEKMEMAIKAAPLAPEVKAQLGDIKTMVAAMVIVGGTLAGIAATGYGAVAEGIGAGLLVAGSFLAGYQMGGGVVDMASFFSATRCDTAKTPQDIQNAGNLFASGMAKIGVGGFFFLLGLAGARAKGAGVKANIQEPPSAFGEIGTPWGAAIQSQSNEAMLARPAVENGATLYRLGTLGKSQVAEAQFWALENPLNPGYASRYGIPPENVASFNFVETATLKPGTPFVTRPAPGIGNNTGGGIEVVLPSGGVSVKTFSGL